MPSDNTDLKDYFLKNDGRLIHKWDHYFDIYERHFRKYVGEEIVVLEIGVFHGGSLRMWKDYFGDRAKIYGIDINPRCKELEEDNVEILIGSQSDWGFLKELKKTIPRIDILIDDGGHTMKQQIITFQELFDHVKDDGVYLCEDVHTSYEIAYGGGYKRRKTFVEFSKKLVDSLNAYHSEQPGLKVNSFTRSTASIHFYDSIVVFEKQLRSKPIDLKSGNPYFENDGFDETSWQIIKRKARTPIHRILRWLRMPSHLG